MSKLDILNNPLENPYLIQARQMPRLMHHDRPAGERLHALLIAKINQDVIDERGGLKSKLADITLLVNDPARELEVKILAKAILEEWLDVFARRLLQAFAYAWNTEPLIRLIRDQIKMYPDLVAAFSGLFDSATFVELVLDGRVQHWAVTARDQAAIAARYFIATEVRMLAAAEQPPKDASLIEQSKTRQRSGKTTAPGINDVRKCIRDSRAAGFGLAQICDRLQDKPRPEKAVWRWLTWPAAFKSKEYRGAVARWISGVQ